MNDFTHLFLRTLYLVEQSLKTRQQRTDGNLHAGLTAELKKLLIQTLKNENYPVGKQLSKLLRKKPQFMYLQYPMLLSSEYLQASNAFLVIDEQTFLFLHNLPDFPESREVWYQNQLESIINQ
jgi:hypothetical protein